MSAQGMSTTRASLHRREQFFGVPSTPTRFTHAITLCPVSHGLAVTTTRLYDLIFLGLDKLSVYKIFTLFLGILLSRAHTGGGSHPFGRLSPPFFPDFLSFTGAHGSFTSAPTFPSLLAFAVPPFASNKISLKLSLPSRISTLCPSISYPSERQLTFLLHKIFLYKTVTIYLSAGNERVQRFVSTSGRTRERLQQDRTYERNPPGHCTQILSINILFITMNTNQNCFREILSFWALNRNSI